MSIIVDKYEEPLSSVINSVFYRTLGISSINAPISDIREFVEADDNPFGGELKKKWNGVFYEVWEWDDINISGLEAVDPIKFASWVFGNGRNTVFVRYRWWDLHLFRAPIERALGLKPGALSLSSLLSEEEK